MYTYYKSKEAKKVHVIVLLFILYSMRVNGESLKCKMSCLISPKSSEFVIFFNKQWSKNNNSEIEKIKRLCLQWDSNPQYLGYESTEHLRNRMRKENCRKRIYCAHFYETKQK